MNRASSKSAFTLIELIIVVSIISVLSVLGITGYNAVQQDARNAKRKGDLKEMQKALEAYRTRHGRYPETEDGPGHVSGHKWQTTCDWTGSSIVVPNKDDTGPDGFIPGLAPEFIPVLPHDPRENRANNERNGGSTSQYGACGLPTTNCYKYISNGADYKILAHCTPEGELSQDDPFFDPNRYNESTGYMWAWQLSSSFVTNNW